MRLAIDRTSPVPLGEQLKAQTRLLIHRGVWPPGELLPTIKETAAALELNANTVAAAYRDLEAEGYLNQRRRAGTRVADHPPRAADFALTARLAADLVEALTHHGLDVSEGVRLAVAQANLTPEAGPVRVAVLAATPLDAERTARRAAALLGERFTCVPQTPAEYRPHDYGLTLVDPALAAELDARPARRANLMPPFDGAALQHGADFPAGAD